MLRCKRRRILVRISVSIYFRLLGRVYGFDCLVERLVDGVLCCQLIPSLDFNAANAVVEATHRHKAIFYDGE